MKPVQLSLNLIENETPHYVELGRTIETNGLGNKLAPDDKAFHDWYRFVLSYPAHLVSYYIRDFRLSPGQVILDPFCGTGTTLVEAKRQGFESVGLEANPIAQFASQVKVDWDIHPSKLLSVANDVAQEVYAIFKQQGIDDNVVTVNIKFPVHLKTLSDDAAKLILSNSISPLPLHKALLLLEVLSTKSAERCYQHLRLAFAKALVFEISNLHFGPEVGVGKLKQDVPVVAAWLAEVQNMAKDLQKVQGISHPKSEVFLADSRQLGNILKPASVDAVITSPPYPNEKDYTRTTRLESVMLGFIRNREDLRNLKKSLVRSNTRGVYKGDDDDNWISENHEIAEIADAIENRRIELGKTSGFEKLYGKVTRLYFGGMARHLIELRSILRPGAQLAYVVGDQASYLRVMIRTGQLLAQIAETVGYDVERIDLFRKRFATATKQELREEVVILRWKG